MSVHIDHTNYEAFYLDYLEGNLSGEALQAFEAFLAEHPELALDDPALNILEPTAETLEPFEKLALKRGIDMNELNAETYEFFYIAREEGLLTKAQEEQLDHWLEANARYRNDAALYALTRFEPDNTQVYGNKSLLKKETGGRVIPMWFTGIAVAAGIALIVTVGLNFGGNGTQPTDRTLTADGDTPQTGQHDTLKSISEKRGTEKVASPKTDGKLRTNGDKDPKQPVKPKGPVKYHPYEREILRSENVLASLEKRPAVLNEGQKSVERTFDYSAQTSVEQNSPAQDIAWVPIDAMKNPIKPVTSTLSETLNTPVDFRTAKAGKRKGGGFYLKIGKLEVSHQSSSASL